LLWFDQKNSRGYSYIKQPSLVVKDSRPPRYLLEMAGIDPAQQAYMGKSHQSPFTDARVWDYLSMLYYLRTADLQPGKVMELPVFNGKRVKYYRVKVAKERLKKVTWDRPAFKLSLSEKGKETHEPLFIWISDDARRLPLRFYAKHGFGAVDGILDEGCTMSKREPAGFSPATQKSLELVF